MTLIRKQIKLILGFDYSHALEGFGCRFTIDDRLALVFSEWGEWSICSVTCGDGTRLRERTCLRGDCEYAKLSSTDLTESESCDAGSCDLVEDTAEDTDGEYCIRMTSSASDVCAHNDPVVYASNWLGGTIQVKQNGKVIAYMGYATKNFEHCVPMSDVDVENDEFSLHATSSDGVCITGLYLNDKQLLVGKDNDLEGFWLDQDQPFCKDGYMSTSHIIIQNGQVVLSQARFKNAFGSAFG